MGKGIVVQVSVDIFVKDRKDYDINFEKKVKAALEKEKFNVCGADCTASWTPRIYFGGRYDES